MTSLSLKCESASSRFQLGEGPSMGLLRDYEPSDLLRMELFEALVHTPHTSERRRVGPMICSNEKLPIPGIVANMLPLMLHE